MTLSFRRAYEKSNPLLSGKRGRRDDVPLEIYYQLDDLEKQVAGLRVLAGADRNTVAFVSGGTGIPTTPDKTQEPPSPVFNFFDSPYDFVPNSASFVQSARTNPRFLAWESVLLRATMTVEVDGGGTTKSRGILFMTVRALGGTASSLIASAVNITVTNNQPFEFRNFLDPVAFVKSWSVDTEFILGFTRATGEPNVRVYGTLLFREKQILQRGN